MAYGEGISIHKPSPAWGAAAACLSLFAYATALFITPALNNEIARAYDASLAMLGQLPMALMFGFIAGVLLTGRIADRLGKSPVMAAGDVAIGAGVLLFAASSDLRTAMFANFIVGLGGGMSEVGSMALVADLYDHSRRTSMANLSQAAFSFGAVGAPIAVGLMLSSGMDWRLGYNAVAAICGAAAVMSLVAAIRYRGNPIATARGQQPGGDRPGLLTPVLGLLSLAAALYVGAEIGLSTWMSVLLERELGAAPAIAASGLSLLWLGLGFGRIAGGFVAGRIGDARLLLWTIGMATVLMGALLVASDPWVVMACSFGLGFCFGPVFPTLVSAATGANPHRSGAVMAIVVAIGALGGAIFPASIGWAADTVGLRPALWACFVLLLADTIIAARLRRWETARSRTGAASQT